jgi:hypothetical protein
MILHVVLVVKSFQSLIQLNNALFIALLIIFCGLRDVFIDEFELFLLQSLVFAYLRFLSGIIELQLLNLVLHVLNLLHHFVNLLLFLIDLARLVFRHRNCVHGVTPFLSHFLQILRLHPQQIIIIINKLFQFILFVLDLFYYQK